MFFNSISDILFFTDSKDVSTLTCLQTNEFTLSAGAVVRDDTVTQYKCLLFFIIYPPSFKFLNDLQRNRLFLLMYQVILLLPFSFYQI